MKTILFYLLLAANFLMSCQGSDNQNSKINKDETPFDIELAEKVGADKYGMKKYVMAFLKAGPNRDWTKEEAMNLQQAHMKNIGRMAEEGTLVVAGPFLDNGELRGIYIFDVETVEEAEALTNTDPAIKAGSLVMELKPWYGSASLMLVKDYHDKLKQEEIGG